MVARKKVIPKKRVTKEDRLGSGAKCTPEQRRFLQDRMNKVRAQAFDGWADQEPYAVRMARRVISAHAAKMRRKRDRLMARLTKDMNAARTHILFGSSRKAIEVLCALERKYKTGT